MYMYMYMYRYMYMYMNMYMYLYMHIAEASIASKRCRERLRRRMLGRFRGDMSSKGDQDANLEFVLQGKSQAQAIAVEPLPLMQTSQSQRCLRCWPRQPSGALTTPGFANAELFVVFAKAAKRRIKISKRRISPTQPGRLRRWASQMQSCLRCWARQPSGALGTSTHRRSPTQPGRLRRWASQMQR